MLSYAFLIHMGWACHHMGPRARGDIRIIAVGLGLGLEFRKARQHVERGGSFCQQRPTKAHRRVKFECCLMHFLCTWACPNVGPAGGYIQIIAFA